MQVFFSKYPTDLKCRHLSLLRTRRRNAKGIPDQARTFEGGTGRGQCFLAKSRGRACL